MKTISLFLILSLSSLVYAQVKGQSSGSTPPNCSGENVPTNPFWQYAPYRIFIPCPDIKVGIGLEYPQYELDVKTTGRFNQVISKNLSIGTPHYDGTPISTNGLINVSTNTVNGNLLNLCRKLSGSQTTEELFVVDAKGAVQINNKSNAAPFIIRAANGNKILQLENSGLLRARRIKVDTDNWADYVFVNGYKLLPLKELEIYIQENGHLPNIPSAKHLEKYGIDVNNMLRLQMEKIEELTLYTLQQESKIEKLTHKVDQLEKELLEIKELLKHN